MQGEGELLKMMLRAKGISQEEAAKSFGMTRQNLALYFHKNKLPRDILEIAKEKLHIDVFNNIVAEPFATYSKASQIPVYDTEVTAGDFEFNGDMPERITGYISLPNFRECKAFVYVRGDSMYSDLKAGDLIGIIPVNDPDIIQYGNIYLIVTHDNQRMVKYIRRGVDDEHLVLRSKNKDYDDIHLHRSKVRRLFMVKGPIRDDWQ